MANLALIPETLDPNHDAWLDEHPNVCFFTTIRAYLLAMRTERGDRITWRQLSNLTERDLNKIYNSGHKPISEIKETLAARGLKLKEE